MKSSRSYSSETFIIAFSFVAVWVYFAIRIWAGRAEIQMSPYWQLLLLPALVLLVMVFMRRVRRVLGALRGDDRNATFPTRSKK